MDDLLNRTGKHSKPVDYERLHRILWNVKLMVRIHKRNYKWKREAQDWGKQRHKVLNDLFKLSKNMRTVCEEFDVPKMMAMRPSKKIRIDPQKEDLPLLDPNSDGLFPFEHEKEHVLAALKNLDEAIKASPIFQTPLPKTKKGHQSEPWLHQARAWFKATNVSKEDGDHFLDLIGYRPDSSS